MQRSFINKPLESEKIEVPLTIQIYLWRQTSVFLKPNLNEKRSYALNEKRSYVCVAFEKIICENRIHDLPPNLYSSMNTIPRWHFVQGALPFVLHCCAALLSYRAQNGGTLDRLTVAETKLLYTLHWILLKAPEEVENYAEKLLPLSTVELFVQAVVPYVNCIQPQDLTFRLQDGLELWEALWEHRAPPLKSFTSSVILSDEKTEEDKTSIATFFDLAILKCLMLPDWHDEGRAWALQYVLKYLENDEALSRERATLAASLDNDQSACSNGDSAELKTDGEAEVSLGSKVGTTSATNLNKLKRFYGFSSQPEESSSGQKRLSVKESFRRNRHTSCSSTSSLFDALTAIANFKLADVENVEVANGAKEFLDESGWGLKKSVFLDVVCQIARQSSNAHVCSLVLSVLEHILDKHVIQTTSSTTKKDSPESVSSDKEPAESGVIGSPVKIDSAKQLGEESRTAKLPFHSSFQKALICVIKVVCALGCSYGCGKGIRGVIGKNLRAKAIAMLTKLRAVDENAFKTDLKRYFEEEDVEVVTDFLHALLGFCTMTLESKATQKKMGDLFKEKRGVVGAIIDCVFASYISKLMEFNLEEISNVTLYRHVRQMVKYVKEFAGGTFFRVVFSGLLKATGEPVKKVQGSAPEPKSTVSTTDSETSPVKTAGSEKSVTPKTPRKMFFPKFSRSGGSSEGSPTGMNEFGFEGPATPMTKKKGLKRHVKKTNTVEELFSVDEDLSGVNSIDRRRKSLMKKIFKPSRKKADEIFTTDSRKAEGASSSLSRQHNTSVEYTSIPVKVKEIRDGMMMFSMLLESSLPGSVPDPHIVSGILELKAPAVARGALLLECAHFVQRCNKGHWPSWLLSSHPSSRRGKGGFGALVRNAIAVSRRNVRIKHEAGLLFYKWAVAIGERLEQIESRKPASTSESKEVVVSCRQLEEDFLDEGTLGEETRKCPYALKMVACHLLLEITAFLRESHSSLAAKAEIQRRRNRSVAFSRNTRRVTQKIPGVPEHRDAVTSGPAERLRQVGHVKVTPIMTLSVPQAKEGGGEKSDQKVTAPVVKVDSDPRNGNDETEKPTQSKKRFSALFSNSEKRRKHFKPENTERKGSISTSRLSKKLPTRAHKVAVKVMSDASDNSDNEEEEVTKFPWLKAVAVVSGSTNFLCEHRDACPPNCIRRQTQSCSKFMSALKTVYTTRVSQVAPYRSKKSEADKGRQCKLSTKELTIKEKEKRDKIMITYIGEKVRNVFNCPMSVLIKGAVVLEPSLMLDIIPLAWELLLSPLEELVSTAAAVFLIASLHLKDVVEKMLYKELTRDSCEHQVKSLIRYGILWRSRYHVWPRMEAGAKFILRIPLPKLDFTLPSPPVGSCAPAVPDCPWDPKASMGITKNELEQTEEDKQKDEEEASKIKEEQKKQRIEYSFTDTSVSLEASFPVEPEGDDIITQPVTTDFWPPAMSTAVPHIIGLLDDSSITVSQTTVSEMAMRILWDCLVDDPTLFFRTFFEEITKPNKQKELVFLLSKLLVHIPRLPPNAGTILFNHLVGVVLFYSRRSQPCSEDAIALILSALMWKIVPSVPNLYLKDLKYSAKKEHCERTLMVTANTPGTKKVVIVCSTLCRKGENEKVTVLEDMSFEHVLQFCTSKWSLDNPLYCLLDAKSGQILEGKYLVRDVYAFKKGFPYPQLTLQLYDEQKGYVKRQEQAFTYKLAEVGRLYLTHGILEAVQNWHHVSFLHSELSKQIAFPRKALDVDFALYEGGIKGMQLCAMDAIHKRMWVKLLSKLFDSMTSAFPWGDNDLHLFLNVINGALLLQCEDSSMLRLCLSTFINTAIKFNDIFAIDGYHHILPTLILLHSHHENNPIVCNAVEFVISQFYCLHQKPFLLQLFASIEPILLTENVNKMPEHSDDTDESTKILPKCLFTILSSLEKEIPDSLDILALVDADKPLKPLDLCYEGKLDSESESKIDIAIRLCVTVVAYSPESIRATQMLVVLSSILPYYLEYVKNKNNGTGEEKKEYKDELTALSSLHCSVQVLLKSCNSLRRPFLKNKGMSAAKKKAREGSTGSMASFTTSHENVRQSKAFVDDEDRDADSIDQQFKPFLNKFSTQDEGEQVLDSLYEFRTPRNAILIIVSEFISTSKNRLREINQNNSSQSIDLSLDSESIQVLCNIAHTLLKLALTDTVSLESTGVQKFMLEALPNIDWSVEEVIPALNLILKRINTTFTKITDKPDLMNFFWPYPLLLHRSENWNVTEVLLKGLYLTFSRQMVVVSLPYTKAVVATCMRLILREQINDSEPDYQFISSSPPPSLSFCQLVVKLAARLMFSLNDRYCLKDLCGGTVEFGSADRTLRVLVHILIPLCIRLGTGSKDEPKASKADISYAVSCFLNIIVTPLVDVSSPARRLSSSFSSNEVVNMAPPGFVQRVLPRKSDNARFSPSIYKAAYLGLKILIICFSDFISSEWRTIAAVLKEVVLAGTGNEALWEFLDFVVLHRTPLFLLLLPIIRTKLPTLNFTSARGKILKETLLKQLSNPPHPTPSRRTWMKRFIQELGVLTGSDQNDMFLCRNPSEPARSCSNTQPDVQSLSDSETFHDRNSGDLHEAPKQPEHTRKLSSISHESNDKTNHQGYAKHIKKKVSFDRGVPCGFNEMTLEAASSVDCNVPVDAMAIMPEKVKQKRELPRQELAVDIDSPISSKKLSLDYPTISFALNLASTGDSGQMVDTTVETSSPSKGKKRRMGKNRKIIHEMSNYEDTPSVETSGEQEVFKEGSKHTHNLNLKLQPQPEINNDIVDSSAEKAVVTISKKLNGKGRCDESVSVETSQQTDFAEAGSQAFLLPLDQSDDITSGQCNVEEAGDKAVWSRKVLDDSKETYL